LRANSDRFAERIGSSAVGRREAHAHDIDHPRVGTPDAGPRVVTAAGSDLRIVIYTAEPGTEDAERPILNPGKRERQESAGRPIGRFCAVPPTCLHTIN
jgi:MmyB-like transcription regulator ligand binding domain